MTLYFCHKIEKSQRIWYEWKYWLMMILWRVPCCKLKSLVIKVFVKTEDKKHATIKKENPSTIKIPIKLMIQEDWNQDCHFPAPCTCIYIFCLMNSRIILFKVLYQTYEFHYQVFQDIKGWVQNKIPVMQWFWCVSFLIWTVFVQKWIKCNEGENLET